MSEVEKAIQRFKSKKHAKESWFGPSQGVLFTVPYGRSDVFVDAFGLEKAASKRATRDDRANCVYPKISGGGGHQSAHIPEAIPLDNLFGFFIGAYLSEGCCTSHHILIANVDDDFNKRIDEFCKQYDINYHVEDRIIKKGRSKTLRLHSYVMAQLLIKSIDTGSGVKRLPAEFLTGPDAFLKGIIDGYFSGDGTVSKKQRSVGATSICRGLLEDIQQVLTKFGVQTKIKPSPSQLRNALKRGMKARMPYNMTICAAATNSFAKHFALTIKSKQKRLDDFRGGARPYAASDIIPNVVTETMGTINMKRASIDYCIKKCSKSPSDQAVFDAIQAETIFYDKVVSIQEVPNPTPYVYDLTVADTRNFNLYNGLAMRDTFHSSGISAASKTVRGVPRLKELLSVSKNIKTPALTIYLKTDPGVSASTEAIDGDPARAAQRRCDAVLKDLKTTHIRDVIKSSSIYFDTDIGDDKDFIKMYKLFGDAMCESTDKSPWLLRLEFDKTKMSDEGLLMEDVHFALETFYDRQIHCMFSDDNAKELVFRIRLADLRKADAAQANSDDVITELKALEQNVLENVIVRGVRGIQNAQMTLINTQRFNSTGSVFEKASEWVIGTYGTNLMTVLGLPEVDCVRTVSNDVHEIYHTLGIEAARMCLINEINECLADVGVNYRHIALLADVMTYKGALLSIDRHGINRSDIGPLAKCSFEETSDMLIKAGMFAEYDPVNGVSANIMLGQVPPCGTGDTTIMIDEDKLRNIHAIKTPIIEKTWADIDEEDNVCTMEGLSFDFKLNGL